MVLAVKRARALPVYSLFDNIPAGPKPDLKLGLVHGASGREISVDYVMLESKKFGLDDAILLEIRLPSVEPDIYTLYINLSRPEYDLEAVTSRTFRIR